jgi:hypothetical protein
MEHTIEQYLIKLTSLSQKTDRFELDPSDGVILNSIAKQVAKGIAMTDRQYHLVKAKLVNYREQFERNDMNDLDLALESLSQPLRTIDRSQTIVIRDNQMVVRFPFNKKTIAQLDEVSSKYRHFYKHERGSNEHSFNLYEPLINDIVELFKNKKFVIDPQLLEISQEIDSIKNRESDFVSKITVDGFVNVDARVEEIAVKEIGPFTRENRIKYWDRSIRYGYNKEQRYFENASALAENLANRTRAKEYVNPNAYDLKHISTALGELDRFPVLVSLSRTCEFEELKTLVAAFDFVDPQHQILLDRVEDSNNKNYGINKYIKEINFSTWLDKDIKIVYIFKNSLPKLLLKGEWRPMTHLSLNGERETTMLASYIEQHCDLNIYYDSQPSYWNGSVSRQLNQWV